MAIYSLCLQTTVTTTGAASWDVKASASNSPKIMELGINLAAGTASTYGFGRAGNSTTQTGAVLLQAENPADPAGQSGCAVAWGSTPTTPAQFFRRIGLPATIATGVIWTFPRGLTLAASAQFLIWNGAVNSAATNIWVVADE